MKLTRFATVFKWLKATYVFVLDVVLVCVLWAWPYFSYVLQLCQVLDKYFGLVVSLRFREREVVGCFLRGEWQNSERSVSLFRIESLR